MVWYYCEFCNRNYNIKAEAGLGCPQCGHMLMTETISQAEKKRREKERTFYCENCDQMVFSVPINVVKREYIMRLKWGNSTLFMIIFFLIPILFVLRIIGAIVTIIGGSANIGIEVSGIIALCVLIGIFLFIGFYFKGKREKRSKMIEDIKIWADELSQEGYEYLCSKCLEGVKRKGSKIQPQRLQPMNILRYCEHCGQENTSADMFCIDCGTEMRVVSRERQDSRYVPKEVVGKVWMRDDGVCNECGSNINLQIDHIIPYSKGGATTLDNLQLLCRSCNLTKSSKIGDD